VEYSLRATYYVIDRDYYLRFRLRYDLSAGWSTIFQLDGFGGGTAQTILA
jgi:hypothetical protein